MTHDSHGHARTKLPATRFRGLTHLAPVDENGVPTLPMERPVAPARVPLQAHQLRKHGVPVSSPAS